MQRQGTLGVIPGPLPAQMPAAAARSGQTGPESIDRQGVEPEDGRV